MFVKAFDDKYTSGDYLAHNPSWDIGDSPWKAEKIVALLSSAGYTPSSICEIGCGAGGILVELRKSFSEAELFGYDIAPDAARFCCRKDLTNAIQLAHYCLPSESFLHD